MDELKKTLWQLQDIDYRNMQIRILPNISAHKIIGIRTPELRLLAKHMSQANEFMNALPHEYFEENQIHAFLLSLGKDFEFVVIKIDEFLPYVDNWATCDQMNPKIFRKHRPELLPYIKKWLVSEHPYTVRFGIKMLMDHFLDEEFIPEYSEMVASIHREEYYVRMMVAWYFATALAKQYDTAYSFLAEYRLEPWVHNKTIQKAVESFRVTPAHKDCLKALRHTK